MVHNRLVLILDKIAEWSIYIMILCLPFGKSIVEITIGTALASLIIKKIITKEKLLTDSSVINIFLYLFLAASLLSLVNSEHLSLSVRAFFSKSLKFAALFLAAKEIINTRTKLSNFIFIASLSCIIILLDGVIQYYMLPHIDVLHNYKPFKYTLQHHMPKISDLYHGEKWYYEREFLLGFPTASFPFPNDFAAWILMFIYPMGLYSFFSKEQWLKRAISGLAFLSLIYFLVLTKVRGAWLGFAGALGVMSFFKVKKIFVVLILFILFASIFVNRALIPDLASFASIGDRTVMWKNGWEIFKKHPIIGNGVNTFFAEYMKVRNDNDKYKKGSYAHNCYLQMAADIGIIGLIFFMLFIFSVLAKGLRSLKLIKSPAYSSLILGIDLGLIAFLIHSFVDTNLYSLNLAALFWLSASISLAAVNIAKSET